MSGALASLPQGLSRSRRYCTAGYAIPRSVTSSYAAIGPAIGVVEHCPRPRNEADPPSR